MSLLESKLTQFKVKFRSFNGNEHVFNLILVCKLEALFISHFAPTTYTVIQVISEPTVHYPDKLNAV